MDGSDADNAVGDGLIPKNISRINICIWLDNLFNGLCLREFGQGEMYNLC